MIQAQAALEGSGEEINYDIIDGSLASDEFANRATPASNSRTTNDFQEEEESDVAGETDEERTQEAGRLGALQQMLMASEIFI